jgi:hypothetical protein
VVGHDLGVRRIRAGSDERAAAQEGLLRLLSKPQTARAAVAMLEKPARAWRLDEIAAAASTSVRLWFATFAAWQR